MDNYRSWVRNFIVAIFFCACFCTSSYAQEMVKKAADNEVIAAANSVISLVAEKIASYKYRYLVFNKFDNSQWTTLGPDGFLALHYTYPMPSGNDLELNVRVLSMDKTPDEEISKWQHMEFPIARIKVVWSVAHAGFYLEGFDLDAVVEDAVWPLVELQQKQLPLKMSIETAKTDYEVGEPVDLDLVVKNVSESQLRVKPLDGQSLYCTLNDQGWGIMNPKPVPSKATLGAGEEMRYRLRLKGIESPGDFRIFCSYGIGFQGVRPQARKVLKIEKASIKDN